MQITQKTDKWYAATIAIIFHGLILLLFILLKIITPIPPFEIEDAGGGGGLGVELNFGDSPDGMGNTNPELLSSDQSGSKSSNQDDNLITDESNDNFIGEIKKPKEKKPRKELIRKQEGPRISQKVEEPSEVIDTRVLFNKKKSGSEGKTGKTGNQGSENGDPNNPFYTGKGGGEDDGNGKGKGGGDGEGDGKGKGNGSNTGISVNLDNRKSISIPKPTYNSDKSGKVVVDITVDLNGNVIKATAGARGTTVSDLNLFKRAEEAAKNAKFNQDQNAPERQIGSITYIFQKQ